MSAPIGDGGPAFPCGADVTQNLFAPCVGLSMRDYFAAKALEGICSANPSADFTDERIANAAFNLADAMVRRRSA